MSLNNLVSWRAFKFSVFDTKSIIVLMVISFFIGASVGELAKPKKVLFPPFTLSAKKEKSNNQKVKNPETITYQAIKGPIKIPILMYHYVEYVPADGNDFKRRSLNIPPNIFENQIVSLKAAGYSFITPKDIKNILEGEATKKYVIISFDDGYEDFFTQVLPIIRKHEVTVINYLVFNFINRPNYLTSEQIKEIIKSDLVEIGAHTLNHRYLPILVSSQLSDEIFAGKKELEAVFNIEVTSFAYPYGAYETEVIEMVKKAGFTTAVTTGKGNLVDKRQFFELARIRPGGRTGNDLISYIESPMRVTGGIP